MKIRRHQLPVAPDFARTIYSMQGFTLSAGKVDLNLGAHSDPVTGYVALSRFRRADDVLILQPFELDVFQQGVADQPALLLEKLRGQDISEGLRVLKQKRELDRATKEAERKAAQADRAKRNLPSQENLTEEQKRRKAPKTKKQRCSACGADKGSKDYRERAWRDRNKPGHRVKCLQCESRA